MVNRKKENSPKINTDKQGQEGMVTGLSITSYPCLSVFICGKFFFFRRAPGLHNLSAIEPTGTAC
jgi:hypothetical protein